MAAYDLAVIGAGPGGYVAAIRAAQLGMHVTVIERAALGGICLNLGCIPSKALLRNAEVLSLINNADQFGIEVKGIKADYGQALTRSRGIVDRLTRGVEALFKKHRIDLVRGNAILTDHNTVEVDDQSIEARNVIIATGARPRTLPGLDIDGELIVTYREAIIQDRIPSHVVIIGGGAIGVEFAYIYNAYGAEVSIIEAQDRILPQEDAEISALLTRALERQGITIHANSRFHELQQTASNGVTVHVETQAGQRSIYANKILVAVGIHPNTESLGLERLGIVTEHGYIKVDDRMRTNSDSIYAIGDVTGVMPLAHVAQAQAIYVVERLAGEQPYPLDYTSMPRAVYCVPQVASFGITEQQAKSEGRRHKVGRFPLTANGKALAMNDQDGFAKIIADADTGELLGGHLIGHEVTEMLGELSLARVMEGSSMEIGAVVNAHPTISEAIKEAALAIDGKAIHI